MRGSKSRNSQDRHQFETFDDARRAFEFQTVDDFDGDHYQSTRSFNSPKRRNSQTVKVDMCQTGIEPSLNERDMLRIFDARNEDIGQGRIIKKDCTPDKLALMLREFCENTGTEPGQVFKHDSALSGAS